MGHVKGGRWRELIPYARFLGRHSLWQSAYRPFVSTLSSRCAPNYLSNASKEGETSSAVRNDIGPAPLSKSEKPVETLLESIKESPSLFTKNWAETDAESWLFSRRLGWVWPALERVSCAQGGIFLWDLVQKELARSNADVETPNSTYTAAEQISNTILLYWILKRSGLVADFHPLRPPLSQRAEFVAKNLEYYGEGDRTNNHLLNNARALYLAGVFLEREAWRQMSRIILQQETRRSLTPSGFLREGSSSYHLLILRWFQEIERAACYAGDTAFFEWVQAQVLRLRGAARFFCPQPGDSFPCFGDVSPDAPLDWLIPLIHGEYTGWNKFWALSMAPLPASSPQGFADFLKDGWARYDGDRYRLFWHVNPVGAIGLYSHAHHDTGAFTLQRGGEDVFVDPGRSTYAPTSQGLYFKSASAHNLFVIDQAEPFVSAALNGTRFFLPEYSYAQVWAKTSGDTLSMGHDGYRRFSGLGSVSRRFQMESSRILIHDKGEGRGRHDVETFFHLGPAIACEQSGGGILLKTNGGRKLVLKEADPGGAKLTVHRAGRGNSLLGWMSTRYGELCPSVTLRWHRRASFPFHQSWIVEFL